MHAQVTCEALYNYLISDNVFSKNDCTSNPSIVARQTYFFINTMYTIICKVVRYESVIRVFQKNEHLGYHGMLALWLNLLSIHLCYIMCGFSFQLHHSSIKGESNVWKYFAWMDGLAGSLLHLQHKNVSISVMY